VLGGPGPSLMAFGAILTAVSDVAGVIVAGLGFAWEMGLFYLAGR
jgi:hypothetical protein